MSKQNKIIIGVAGVAIVILIIFGSMSGTQNNSVSQVTHSAISTQENNLPGLQVFDIPWQAEIDHLSERLSTIGLPALSQEGTVLHIHQHVDIFIQGKSVAIPASIGINEQAGFISPIHIHDTTGIIHVESPTIQKFTLGQFFDIWGVRFNQNSIGGYTNDASSTLQVYVNGQKVTGNPRDIELTAHEEIVITYGTQQEEPKIPTTYSFLAGL